MIRRFEGLLNRDSLVSALRRQQIVQADFHVAGKIADVCNLMQFEAMAPDNVLIKQEAVDNDLFLIIAGQVSISVNGRELAVRGAGQHVGEMAMIDPSAPRSATVTAITQTVVARIQERDFAAMAAEYPFLWRQLAVELGCRLRERSRFVKAPNPRPVVFIGSSRESLAVVREIQSLLSHDNVLARPWTDGFRPSSTAVESLERELQGADFAVLVLAADDLVESRDVLREAPRDNVIWEHGFFTGGLSRSRVFVVRPRDLDLKVPSDWGGVTWLDYDSVGTTDDLSSRLGGAVNTLRKEVARLSVK